MTEKEKTDEVKKLEKNMNSGKTPSELIYLSAVVFKRLGGLNEYEKKVVYMLLGDMVYRRLKMLGD